MEAAPTCDWRRWYAPEAGRPPSEHLFLADAVHIAGEALCMPYDRGFPLLSTLPAPPVVDVPDTTQAFDGETPIAAIHDRFGHAVRDVLASMPIDEEEARNTALMQRIWPDRWELLAPPTRRDASEPIPRADWEIAVFEIAQRVHLGAAARAALRTVADAIAALAFAGEIRTLCRPITGASQEQEMAPVLWKTATPIWRLAWCGLDLDAPFDPDACPTHHIFVARAGFAGALRRHAETHAVALTSLPALSTDEEVAELYADIVERVTQALDVIIAKDPDHRWRKPQLLEELKATDVGTVETDILDAGRRNLFEKYPKLKTGGAPTGPRKQSAEIDGRTGRRAPGETTHDNRTETSGETEPE